MKCFSASKFCGKCRPPFNAPNIMELEKVIKKQDIPFPRHINKISSMAEGLIRSMLAYDP